MEPVQDDRLTGTIENKQFQGKEYHYFVTAFQGQVIVPCPLSDDVEMGQTVSFTRLYSV